ncbi:shTK domain protein [Ancylostoma duodenale]|uniref:ShTK domain protein n=1 Tax=Ancylostoma duodenale TaxID=51022 RepID=A0A0C2GD02_9BILA|nr:shTK domain protein [Ancylostoma duodenale]
MMFFALVIAFLAAGTHAGITDKNCTTADGKMNSADSEEKKQAMINMCPNTCGYCCLTPQYNCANREFPGVTCASVTQAQCNDPKWREIIARDCPNVCGFCLEGMQAFVQVNCKKTCGYCTGSSSTQYPGGITFAPGTCMDNSKSCASWKQNGFCESRFYNAAQKAQNCARTCGLC